MAFKRQLVYGGNTSFLRSEDLRNLMNFINTTSPSFIDTITKSITLPDGQAVQSPWGTTHANCLTPYSRPSCENLVVVKQARGGNLNIEATTARCYVLKIPPQTELFGPEEQIALLSDDDVLVPVLVRKQVIQRLLRVVLPYDAATALNGWMNGEATRDSAGLRANAAMLLVYQRTFDYCDSVLKACPLRMSRTKNKLTPDEQYRLSAIAVQRGFKNAVVERHENSTRHLQRFLEALGVATRAQQRAKMTPTLTTEFEELKGMIESINRISEKVMKAVTEFENAINLKEGEDNK